jgi:hypothetical protein
MKTFETYTKIDFIEAINKGTWSNWLERYEYPNEFKTINSKTYVDKGILVLFGLKTMNLNFILGTKTISGGYQRVFYEIIDIPNFDDRVSKLNSNEVLKIIDNDVYILKDNLNLFRQEIDLKPLSEYYHNKLSSYTGFKLVKNRKMFEREVVRRGKS